MDEELLTLFKAGFSRQWVDRVTQAGRNAVQVLHASLRDDAVPAQFSHSCALSQKGRASGTGSEARRQSADNVPASHDSAADSSSPDQSKSHAKPWQTACRSPFKSPGRRIFQEMALICDIAHSRTFLAC